MLKIEKGIFWTRNRGEDRVKVAPAIQVVK